jgi:acyl-CoA hydrolase
MELRSKKVSESTTEQVHLLMDRDMNGAGRLYGGQLLYWIDEVASVVAMRHSNRNVITVAIERQHFKKPCHLGDLVVLRGQVVYVGKSSMQIRVNSFVEDKQGMRRLINTAYFVMVGLDDNDKPTKVPGLITESESEKAEYIAAQNRIKLMRSELI